MKIGDKVSCWVGCHPAVSDGMHQGIVLDTKPVENSDATVNFLAEKCIVKLDNGMVITTESYNLKLKAPETN
jgi:hypothetical protein